MGRKELELTLEREMALLHSLPAPPLPRPEFVARLKLAVAAEAVRVGAPAGGGVRRWMGIAAALVLAVGLGRFLSQSPPSGPEPELVDAWVVAVEQSGAALNQWLNDGWIVEGRESPAQAEDWLDSLERSFEQFEQM